jgi:hypothetical protein
MSQKQPRKLAIYCRARNDDGDAIGLSLETQLNGCLQEASRLPHDGQPLVLLDVQRGANEPFEPRSKASGPGSLRPRSGGLPGGSPPTSLPTTSIRRGDDHYSSTQARLATTTLPSHRAYTPDAGA